MTILFFDTETNGLPGDYNAPISDAGNWPKMLQLAWLLTDHTAQKRIASASALIVQDDDFVLDAGAAEVHGITPELLGQGLAFEDVIDGFDQALSQAFVIAGHNIEFDVSIVGSELMRHRLESLAQRLLSKPRICTMKQATNFCKIGGGRFGYKWPRLGQLHQKLFNEDFDGAHDVMNDVNATARCAAELIRLDVLSIPMLVKTNV